MDELTTQEKFAFTVFERTFKEFGLPQVIRTDNGVPFAPADVYARSPRVYRGLDELTYPFHDQTILVTGCGRICFRGRKVNLSQVFAGQRVA